MNYQQAKVRADILKALAHPVRILIVNALSGGDRCVCELAPLVDIDQSGLSRHLAILKRVGVVTERRNGNKVIHHLQTPCILRAFECAVEVVRSEVERKVLHLKAI
jgi:ArsR family transcriptional regulator